MIGRKEKQSNQKWKKVDASLMCFGGDTNMLHREDVAGVPRELMTKLSRVTFGIN